MQLSPYLFFGGRCAAAFAFYKEFLGAKDVELMSFRGSPAEAHAPEEWRDKIMHGSLKIGDRSLMGSDGMAGQPYDGVKGCAMALNVPTAEEAERVFSALSQGGKVTMPLDKTFFASKFGMLTDQFGIDWMVIAEA